LFENVSFKLKEREILVIEGQSGCGKTSLLRLIAGLDHCDDGDVYLWGRTPREYSLPDWRVRVAYLGAARVNFEGSPRDLFKIFSKLSAQTKWKKSRGKEEKERKMSYDVTLEELISEFRLAPEILDAEWHRLSSGEYQRVALALTVALKPDVLLLDEPTAQLDDASTDIVEKTLTSLPIPILWITHNQGQAQRVGTYQLKFPGPVLSTVQKSKGGSGTVSGSGSGGGVGVGEKESEH